MKFFKLIFKIILFFCIVIIAFWCWNSLQKKEILVTNSTKAVITKLHTISKLETAEMTITKIMEAKKEMADLFPDFSFDDFIQEKLFQDKMIFELEWHVVAWIDLEKIATWDIVTHLDWSVSIKLPQSEILHVVIDENSKTFDRQIGLLTKWDKDMETALRNQAKKEMREEAIANWILQVADSKAHDVLKTLLQEIDVELSN